MLKALLYIPTLTIAMCFAFHEMKLKKTVIDRAKQSEKEIDAGIVLDQLGRQRVFDNLPHQTKEKVRTAATLKFVFVFLFILEVLVLQR